MRRIVFSLLFLPSLVCAETFTLPSPVTGATVFPHGAEVTRKVPFSVPAGRHVLILRDLPRADDFDRVRVSVEGATRGEVTTRRASQPPRAAEDRPEIAAARARIEAVEEQMQAVRDSASRARLAVASAEARIAFLAQLGRAEGLGAAGVEALRGISQMIGREALDAREAALEGEIEARRIEGALTGLGEELEQAQQALAALSVEDDDRAYLAVAIDAATETSGTLTAASFTFAAGWVPEYDLHLTRGAEASVRLDRGARVAQQTGENWNDAALTLSTLQPAEGIAASALGPQRVVLYDPASVQSRGSGPSAAMAEPAPRAPIIAQEKAAADFGGYAVVYPYPQPVSIATGADFVSLALDSLTLEAGVIAKAVPLYDRTAFLEAHVTNTTGEPLLATDYAAFHVDGTFVGNSGFAGLSAGGEADLPFGPVDGLRLERVVTRNEGDSGFISKLNEHQTAAEIEITNLTGEFWPLLVIDRVPYGEQEDLRITWSATPRPDETGVDKMPGLLAWNIGLAPGASQVIELKFKMTWPVGQQLQ